MKVLVVGSGAREHALVWKIRRSPLVKKVFACPGNAGIAEEADCHDISIGDISGLANLAEKEGVELTVVGPEAPLVAGIVDEFRRRNLRIFGPERSAAFLEGSKVWAKQRMARFGVPTARFQILDEHEAGKVSLQDFDFPCVIKANGLAGGKGVTIVHSEEEAEKQISRLMKEKILGEAGSRVVMEEYLEGEELSILAFTDGRRVLPLASSQDHKRAFDGDEGPNTGGMGAYSPCPLVGDSEVSRVVQKTIEPMVLGLAEEGICYRGLIYAGLMMTEQGPYVLEYNVRFGDPEAQALLPRLESDLVPILREVAEGQLETKRLEWSSRFCVSVVIASGGYPGSYETGFPIEGLDKLRNRDGLFVFHGGTQRSVEGGYFTSGGRVLNVAALGRDLKEARDKAYEGVRAIRFPKAFYRSDIGWRALRGFTVSK